MCLKYFLLMSFFVGFLSFSFAMEKNPNDVGGPNTSSVQMPFSDQKILQCVTPEG